jgi:hypothetical protein
MLNETRDQEKLREDFGVLACHGYIDIEISLK